MDDASLFARIIDLYDAALDPDRLKKLASIVWRCVGSRKGSVLVVDQATGRVLSVVAATENFDDQARFEYASHYHDLNPWVQAAKRRRPPYVVQGADLVPDEVFARSEFCAEWCARVGVFHLLGGRHWIGGGVEVATAAYRARAAGGFCAADKAQFALVAHHVARAVAISEKLRALTRERQVGLDLLDALDLGVVLLDERGAPVFANGVADVILRTKRWLCVRDGGIRPTRRAEEREFSRLVAATASAGGGSERALGGVVRLSDPLGEVLPVLVAPMRLAGAAPSGGASAVVLVFSHPETRYALNARRIGAAFGLTPTEGAVVAALAGGRSLAEYAEEAGVSVNTAKSQLAAVFDKTGRSRQADLVAATLAQPALRLGPLT